MTSQPDTSLSEPPVQRAVDGVWELRSHELVADAARDPERFSSRFSAHLHLPNGLDGEQHRAYRTLIDRYMTPGRVAALEPQLRRVARELVAELAGGGSDRGAAVRLDAVAGLGAPFAVRAQTCWLGWPHELEQTLLDWIEANHEASRSGIRARNDAVAREFDGIIHSVLAPRRAAGDGAADDVTTELMRDEALGRPLTDEEIVSILRNWTGGDLGSLALCVGVIAHFLATNTAVFERIRSGIGRTELAAIVDEILRIDDPFLYSRRVTACPVDAGGTAIAAGERVRLDWAAANRDPGVFEQPERFDPAAHADRNLVYGAGPHHCPGRSLATTELCLLVEELVAASERIELDPAASPQRAEFPIGGYARVPLLISLRPAAAATA